MTNQTGLLSILIAAALLLPVTGRACEEHAKAGALAAGKLPDQSLYHLDSTWTDQGGKKIRLAGLAGDTHLIAMVFTKCPTACPLIVQEIKNMRERVAAERRDHVKVSLFSFDETETAATVGAFVSKYKLDGKTWSVLRSSASSVAELAAALNIQYKRLPSGDFVHANVIFLVDNQGTILAKSEGFGATEDFLKALDQAVAKGH